MKKIENQHVFLPRYFRVIGFLLALISVVIFILRASEIIKIDLDVFYNISGSILLLALLLIALTRDKIEDELTIIIRLKAFSVAFLTGVFLTIFEPYMNLFLDGKFYSDKGPMGILIFMFMFFFFVKYQLKKSR